MVAGADRDGDDRRAAGVAMHLGTDHVHRQRFAVGIGWLQRAERLLESSGTEVKQRGGGDGFFAVFESPDDAVACAVAIRRRFAREREEHGFAPGLRIGVHEAEALQRGDDFAGLGMHEAARISGITGAGEILASRSTVDAAGAVAVSPAREVELKGIADRVAVQAVAWEERET